MPRLLLKNQQRFFLGIGLLIRSLGHHGVEGVRDAEDPGAQGNILAGDPARIAAAVVMLMMADDRRDDIIEGGQVADDADGVLHMGFHDGVLLVGQFHHLFDLADVGQHTRPCFLEGCVEYTHVRTSYIESVGL